MRSIAGLLPTAEGVERNQAKIAGFVAGLIIPLIVVGLFTVVHRGYGFSETPVRPAPIYPNL